MPHTQPKSGNHAYMDPRLVVGLLSPLGPIPTHVMPRRASCRGSVTMAAMLMGVVCNPVILDACEWWATNCQHGQCMRKENPVKF